VPAPVKVIAEPKAKKIVTLEMGLVYRDLKSSPYLESEEELDEYLAVLKERLSNLIASNHKVRIK